MKLFSKEYYELMESFEKVFLVAGGYGIRFDREQDKGMVKRGYYYEHGETNNLFKAYLSGFELGKQSEYLENI